VDAEPTYSANQIAAMVGANPSTVYRAYKEGHLASIVPGRKRSTLAQVRAWARPSRWSVRLESLGAGAVTGSDAREDMRQLRARNATLAEELALAQYDIATLTEALARCRRRAATHRAALLRYLADEEADEQTEADRATRRR